MSDLISRKALCEFCLNTKDRTVDTNDIMRFPSAEPEKEWIPISERLPKNHKDVLVCGVEAISNECVYGVKRWDADTWRPISAPSIRWIAWMPLPDAPEEER